MLDQSSRTLLKVCRAAVYGGCSSDAAGLFTCTIHVQKAPNRKKNCRLLAAQRLKTLIARYGTELGFRCIHVSMKVFLTASVPLHRVLMNRLSHLAQRRRGRCEDAFGESNWSTCFLSLSIYYHLSATRSYTRTPGRVHTGGGKKTGKREKRGIEKESWVRTDCHYWLLRGLIVN